jgi:hypothetical protein
LGLFTVGLGFVWGKFQILGFFFGFTWVDLVFLGGWFLYISYLGYLACICSKSICYYLLIFHYLSYHLPASEHGYTISHNCNGLNVSFVEFHPVKSFNVKQT